MQAAAYALGSLARNTDASWRGKLASAAMVQALSAALRPGHDGRRHAALYCLRCAASNPK